MTTETELDQIALMFDGANVLVHGFDGIIDRWTSGCEALYGWPAMARREPWAHGR